MIVRNCFTKGITLFTALCMLATAYSQTTYKEVNITPPNAASLGKYVDVPVSYHTGMPQIGVPIYTVSEGPLSLPIGLSYHPGGLKVAEPAGWVGAGWSLQAGGVISRTVVGQPDERYGQGNGVQTHGYFSDYGYNNYLVPPGATQTDDAAFRDGRKDGEPDLFFFNFAGYGGKFYFHDDRTPVLVPEQDIKIQAVYPETGSINSFIITTPDGTKYYFGKTESTSDVDPVEISNPYSSSVGLINSQLINSWYLNKVVSAEGNFTIQLQYVEEKYGYHTVSSFPKASNDPEPEKEFGLVKNHVKGVRLWKIIFTDGDVEFEATHNRQDVSRYSIPQDMDDAANTEAKALTSIKISNHTTLCRQFDLSYGYFEDNNTNLANYFNQIAGGITINTDRKRLKLTQVREKSCNSIIELPPTIFDYHTEMVPRRLSLGLDFWGFANGQNSNQKLIATYTVNKYTTVPGANRDPAWPAMRGGALKKITYPTGGNTEFEFEPNKVWLSFLKYNQEDRFSFSMGYDGSTSQVSRTDVYTANPYKFIVSNSAAGGTAFLNPMGLEVPPGQTKEIIWQPGAGNHTISLYKQNPSTGNGVSATCKEMVPFQYQNNEIVGGLRIKAITQNDATTTTPIVTNFSYDVNGQSSGKLYGRPVVVQVIRNEYWKPEYGMEAYSPNGCISVTTPIYYRSGGSVRPMENTQGNHIGYNEVKVEKLANGFSVYRYFGSPVWENNLDDIAVRNVDIVCNENVPLYPPAPLPYEPKRGELKYEGHFDNTGQVISAKDYNYAYTENPVKTPGFLLERHIMPGAATHISTFYELSTWKKTQTTITETLRDPATGNAMQTSSITDYASNYHTQATQSSTTNSTAVPLVSKMKYAYDYRPAACDAVTSCYTAYTAACSTANSNYYAARAACGDVICRKNAFVSWRMNLATARQNYLSCRQQNFTNTNSTFNTAFNNAYNSADAGLKPVLEMYKRGINTVVENTTWKNNQLTGAAYNHFVLKSYYGFEAIEVTQTDKINLAAPLGSFQPSVISGNSIGRDSRYKPEIQVTMNRENVQEIKKPNSTKTSYVWDDTYNQTLAVAVNANAAEIAFTSFETAATGGFTYDPVSVMTTNKITGKKSFMLYANSIAKTGLNAATTYTVTYWAHNNTGTVLVNNLSGQVMRSLPNGWQQYRHSFTGNTGVTITGTGVIDELRLHPANAVMTSYTYEPLVGMLTQTDANNRISYYEYDQLGRLGIIRDMQGNIVKKICYKYNGQTGDCITSPALPVYYNTVLWRVYCRNNCPPNHVAGCYDLQVPAGMFSSTLSQAEADAQALAYADATGQAWINANGACTPCTGVDKKIINNVCETGVKVYTTSYYDLSENTWFCVYHYEFSDGSWTQDFSEYSAYECQ